MSIFTRVVVAATHNPIVRGLVRNTRPGRLVAERFVAGDTLDQAEAVTRAINDAGMPVSLDHLGEEVHDRGAALKARREYLECVERIGRDGLDANISVKLTQLGLGLDRRLAAEAIDELAVAASAAGTTVTIDMEDSRFTEDTIGLYAAAQERHGNLGVCVQSYLRRTAADLEKIMPLGGHIRLCKGAYVEPPELAYQTRSEIDAAFLALLEAMMDEGGMVPAIATHDDALVDRTIELARQRSEPFEFQMLYGVRPDYQRSLVASGQPLRVYVPYGSEWYAYLTRRMAERPANTFFFVRALVGRA